MNGDDKVSAKSLHTPFCATTFRLTLPPQIKRHVILEQLEQLRARGLRPVSIATSHDEGQARAGVLDARFVCCRRWKKRVGIVWVVLQNGVQEATTDPKADPTAREGNGERPSGRREKVGG